MLNEIVKKLNSAKRIALFTHKSADPDALGSVGAMYHTLTSMGKFCGVFLNEEYDEKFEFLKLENVFYQPTDKKFDLALSLDAADADRLGVFKDYFLNFEDNIAIDHHSSRKVFGKLELIKHESSNCEILLELIQNLTEDISVDTANCLYFGLLGDTGGFSNNGTTKNSFLAGAKLYSLGAKTTDISNILFRTKTLNELKLQEKMLSRIEIYNNIGISYILEKDKKELGLLNSKSGDLVGIIKSIKGIDIAVMIKQRKGKNFEISLRSSFGTDVSSVAEKFGGGGHKQASGLGLVGNLNQVKKILLKELTSLGK